MPAESLLTAHSKIENDCLASMRATAARLAFHPRGTVRCEGAPLFRNQLARDFACLLDVDAGVISWRCLPMVIMKEEDTHVPDFLVQRTDGSFVADAVPSEGNCASDWVCSAVLRQGHRYEAWPADRIRSGFRLQNAQDLLRYARWQTPLGDRVRLLAALDEHSSLTVVECLSALREIVPIAGLSSLILHRFVEIDLDEARIGPETTVRRCRD